MHIDLTKIQTRLEHKQAELQTHIHEETGQALSEKGTSQVFEQVTMDLLTAQKQHSVLANEILLLNEVRFALKRLTEGTYGFCVMCGQPIPERRLEALPWAALCINDQQRLEQKLHSYAS